MRARDDVRRDHSYGVWQHRDYQRLTGRLCGAFGHAADSAAGQAVAAGQGALFGALLLHMDAGGDQQISRDEFTAALGRGSKDRPGFDTAVRAAVRTLVQVADQDGSGALDTGEYARLAAVYGARRRGRAGLRPARPGPQRRAGQRGTSPGHQPVLHQPGPRRLRQPRLRPPVTAPPARVQAWSLVTGTRPGPPVARERALLDARLDCGTSPPQDLWLCARLSQPRWDRASMRRRADGHGSPAAMIRLCGL